MIAAPPVDGLHSEVCEAACLGPVLLAQPAVALRTWLTVMEHCPRPDAFFQRNHRLIALTLNQLANEGAAFDATMVIQRMSDTSIADAMDVLSGRGKWPKRAGVDYGASILAGIGGAGFIMELSEGGSLSSVETNARQVALYYRARQAIERVNKARDALAATGGVRAMSETVSALIADLCALEGSSSDRSLGDCARSSLVIHDAIKANAGTLRCGSWGLPRLDELVPLKGGRFIVLAAPPKKGKTTLAISMTRATAKALGPDSVAYLSLEMNGEDVANVVIAQELGLSTSTIENGELMVAQRQAAEVIRERLDRERIFIRDTIGDMTAKALTTWIRRLHMRSQGRLALVVVDYLQLLAPDNDRQQEVAKLGNATRAIKVLAAELKVCIAVLSQFSRESTKQGRDKVGNLADYVEPQVSDLRGSGTIEQDCDAAVLLWPRKVTGTRARTTAKIALNRRGPCANVDLDFKFSHGGGVEEAPAPETRRASALPERVSDSEDLFNA